MNAIKLIIPNEKYKFQCEIYKKNMMDNDPETGIGIFKNMNFNAIIKEWGNLKLDKNLPDGFYTFLAVR